MFLLTEGIATTSKRHIAPFGESEAAFAYVDAYAAAASGAPVEEYVAWVETLLRDARLQEGGAAMSGPRDVAPMRALRELREMSPESREHFGFPYNVPDDLSEEEGRVIAASAPPAWLVAHVDAQKRQRR
jgi:hypothetical protein